jgi:hypothetical protein
MSAGLTLLYSGLLVVVFLAMLNDCVRPNSARINEGVLGGLWLGLVVIAFAAWGWGVGVAALLLSVGYGALALPVARGAAERLKAMRRRSRLRL